MNENPIMAKMVGVALTLTVATILIAALLMPVINNAQHANDTVYHNNNPYAIGSLYEFDESAEETVVITICNTSERTVSINGEVANVAAYQPIFISDVCSIRFYANSMNFASVEGSRTVTTATITINQGIASFEVMYESTPIEISSKPINWAFIHNGNGGYVAFNNDSPTGFDLYSYENGIYAANWITTTQEYFSVMNGVVTISTSSGSRTVPIDWRGEYLDNGVYKMHLTYDATSDYTFVTDNAGDPYTVSPFLVFVPKEIVGTPDKDSSINSIYGAIPVILLAALVVYAANLVRVKNE